VIPFPAARREDELVRKEDEPTAPFEPAEPAVVPAPDSAREEKTVREPLAYRRSSEPAGAPLVGGTTIGTSTPPAFPAVPNPAPAGPGGTQRVTREPAAQESPVAATLSSAETPEQVKAPDPFHETPSTRDKGSKSGRSGDLSSSRSSEDQFFRAGDEGMYEGGHASLPPERLLSDSDDGTHLARIVRTPEQEARRAGLIRAVVFAMGFIGAIAVLGIVLKNVSKKPVEATPAVLPPAPQPERAQEPPVPARVEPAPPRPIPAPPEATQEPSAAPAATTPPAPIDTAKPAAEAPKPASEASAAPKPTPEATTATKPAPEPAKPKPEAAAPKPKPAPAAPKPAAAPKPEAPAAPAAPPVPAAPAGTPATAAFPD